MLLELKNFKCWENKIFSLGEKGITLLSGKSGVGKTSIIEAIIFVLFGTGRKITQYGHKSCFVSLETNFNKIPVKIIRQKGPNRLQLIKESVTYEDAAAQAIINEQYSDSYQSVGYLSQSSYNSFVLMGPQDKLAFLEKLVFRNIDIKDVRSKVNSLIKERTHELQTNSGKITMLKQILDENDIPELPQFPLKGKGDRVIEDEKNQNIAIQNQDIQRRNALKKIQNCDKKLEKLQTMLQDTEKYEDVLYKNNTQLDMLRASEKNIGNDTPNTDKLVSLRNEKENINQELQKLRDIKKYIDLVDNYEIKQSQLENAKQDEKELLEKKEAEIKVLLINQEDEQLLNEENIELREYIVDVKLFNKINKEIELLSSGIGNSVELTHEIENLSKEIEQLFKKIEQAKLYGKKYKCPSCKLHLSICKNSQKLIKWESELDENSIQEFSEKLARRQKKLSRKQDDKSNTTTKLMKKDELTQQLNQITQKYADFDPTDDLDELELQITENTEKILLQKRYMSDYKDLTDKLNDQYFKNNILRQLSDEVQTYKQKIFGNSAFSLEQKDELKNIVIDFVGSEKVLVEKLNHITGDYEYISRRSQEFETIKNEIVSLEMDNNRILKEWEEKYKNKLTTKSINKHIKIQNVEKDENQKILNTVEQKLIEIEKWNIHNRQYKQYQDHQNELEKLESNEKKYSDALNSAYRLRELMYQAEAISITRIIDSINEYVTRYLDIFFQDNPIKVLLSPYTYDKKQKEKSQITISVDYKGMETDISCLSGGELQRVIIAYNLALSELFSVPMILLDECTSNLDQELTETVVKGIKYNFESKSVILIAHQVVSGIFDQVVTI